MSFYTGFGKFLGNILTHIWSLEKHTSLKLEEGCYFFYLPSSIISQSRFPTRASYSGQVDEFRNPMKTELKTRPCLKAVFQIIWNTDAIFLICILIKQQKHVANKQLFNHTFYETNFKPKLFTANVECNGTVIKLPKTEKPILFLHFKFSLNGGGLVFWFSFNLAVDFRPKMALTLAILSDQMHMLPWNSAEHTLFLFFASFRRSKSALRHLLCEATCSLRTDKQLGNNVTSVDEYSKIVTVQQLGDRIMHIMHISRLKYNSWIEKPYSNDNLN